MASKKIGAAEKTADVTAEEKSDRVPVRIPRGDDVYICVNGKGYLLPGMKTSEVPSEVAEEYYRSEAAKDRFYDTTHDLSGIQSA